MWYDRSEGFGAAANESSEQGRGYSIAYYQWTPLMLICAAALFSLPGFLWALMNHVAACSLITVGEACQRYDRTSYPTERQKIMTCTAASINEAFRHRSKSCPARCAWKLKGTILCAGYIVIKFFYVVTVTGVFYLLETFLSNGIGIPMYGVSVIIRIVMRMPWSTSTRFPLVTICRFTIEEGFEVHHYETQCSLPANLLNELVFLFLWFWFLAVGIATVFSFLRWVAICLGMVGRPSYVTTRLAALIRHQKPRVTGREARNAADEFVAHTLRADTYLAIRLVGHNVSDGTASELVFSLWHAHEEEETENARQGQLQGDQTTNRQRRPISAPQLQYSSLKDTGTSSTRRRIPEPKETNLDQLWVARTASDEEMANSSSLTDLYPGLNMNLNM